MWAKDKFLSLAKSKILKEVYKLARQIEIEKGDTAIEQLRTLLIYLENHPDKDLKRLSQQASMLKPGISENEIFIILTGLEHYLEQSVTDAQFLNAIDSTKRSQPLPFVVILDNLRSAFNVGSIFRTAEFFAAQEIILCGYTPTPKQSQVAKAAMGAEQMIPWQQEKNVDNAIKTLKEKGYQIVALETKEGQPAISFSKPTAVLLGNEKFGLSRAILQQADACFFIRGNGRKNSLNVASAFAIAAFQVNLGLSK